MEFTKEELNLIVNLCATDTKTSAYLEEMVNGLGPLIESRRDAVTMLRVKARVILSGIEEREKAKNDEKAQATKETGDATVKPGRKRRREGA